jgi:hypothetical protein
LQENNERFLVLRAGVEERSRAHLDPFLLINANEVTALAQDLAAIANAAVILDPALIAAQNPALTELEIAEQLALAPGTFDGEHACVSDRASDKGWLRKQYDLDRRVFERITLQEVDAGQYIVQLDHTGLLIEVFDRNDPTVTTVHDNLSWWSFSSESDIAARWIRCELEHGRYRAHYLLDSSRYADVE